MNIEAKLKSWKKKTITISELKSLFDTIKDAELFGYISNAVNNGLVEPVKASGSNGNHSYPLFMKYRILLDEDYTDAISEIDMLHPAITKNGYLKTKPELYLQYKEQIQKMSRYLFGKRPSVFVSKKERSFEIFDEEKQLEDNSFRNLLDRVEITKNLCFYETPEYCFNDFIPERKARMTLLICENKDIWFNIRRRMYEDSAMAIFGYHIDGVVYGSGNKVSEKGALSEYTNFMRTENIEYLYWGDIDRAGLNIYLSLVKNNPELNIKFFIPAYEEMLRLAENHSIPDSADHRERVGEYATIYSLFSDEMRKSLSSYIDTNKRIPQEIISYETLLKVMR